MEKIILEIEDFNVITKTLGGKIKFTESVDGKMAIDQKIVGEMQFEKGPNSLRFYPIKEQAFLPPAHIKRKHELNEIIEAYYSGLVGEKEVHFWIFDDENDM